jgi:hypothetical protein
VPLRGILQDLMHSQQIDVESCTLSSITGREIDVSTFVSYPGDPGF